MSGQSASLTQAACTRPQKIAIGSFFEMIKNQNKATFDEKFRKIQVLGPLNTPTSNCVKGPAKHDESAPKGVLLA